MLPNKSYKTNGIALCAAMKPIEFFESAAKRHFQKILWITQALKEYKVALRAALYSLSFAKHNR